MITVQLPGSNEITEMDESLLTKKEYVEDTPIDTWEIVEYFLGDDLVHRSAKMTANKTNWRL